MVSRLGYDGVSIPIICTSILQIQVLQILISMHCPSQVSLLMLKLIYADFIQNSLNKY